jgi:hypothetical protein
MNVNNFANYLLALLLALQLIGYFVLFGLWSKFGVRGMLLGVVLMFIVDTIALYYIQTIKVYDSSGVEKDIGQILGDVFAVAVWLAISTVVFTIVTMFIGYHLAVKTGRRKSVGLFIPFLAAGTLYGSLAFVTKVCKKQKY